MSKPRELFHEGHYNVLAKRIRNLRQLYTVAEADLDPEQMLICTEVNKALDGLVLELADWFENDNPRFERDLWMGATCVVEQS